MENYMLVIYGLLVSWTLFSIYYTIRVWRKGVNRIIPYVYDTIPNVYTTIGVLGTFVEFISVCVDSMLKILLKVYQRFLKV